jgi:hypothetical protein
VGVADKERKHRKKDSEDKGNLRWCRQVHRSPLPLNVVIARPLPTQQPLRHPRQLLLQ